MTIKYPSIEQYKNVIRRVKDITRYSGKDDKGDPIFNNDPLPTLKFVATVKIHGTNAGIRLNTNGEFVAQSRERDLTLTSDNAGFCAFTLQREAFFKDILSSFGNVFLGDTVVLYGEWAGQNIQKGVAVSQLPKRFYIFGVKIVDSEGEECWIESKFLGDRFEDISGYSLEELHSNDCYLITEFPTWEFDIDFENPESVQNEFVRIVDEVEKACPVGKHFGVSGIGEGIVVSHRSDKYGLLQFKCKGEAHSNSKVKTVAPVDEMKFAAAKEFAENYVTEARLEQAINVLTNEHQLDMTLPKNIGQFIRWVTDDVFKEEHTSIVENNLDAKVVAKAIQNIARPWYLNRV